MLFGISWSEYLTIGKALLSIAGIVLTLVPLFS